MALISSRGQEMSQPDWLVRVHPSGEYNLCILYTDLNTFYVISQLGISLLRGRPD